MGAVGSAYAEDENKLWSLQWCHFYAPFLPAVYEKYKERGGRPVFHPKNPSKFRELFTEIYLLLSFFYKNEEKDFRHECMHPKILEDGRLDYWPEGFFDEWDKALYELI